MTVRCDVEEDEVENENGRMVEATRATCGRCDHETFAYGTGDVSRRRCLWLMNQECPNGESNFYVES